MHDTKAVGQLGSDLLAVRRSLFTHALVRIRVLPHVDLGHQLLRSRRVLKSVIGVLCAEACEFAAERGLVALIGFVQPVEPLVPKANSTEFRVHSPTRLNTGRFGSEHVSSHPRHR